MTRLLFWVALVILVVTAVRNKLRGLTAPRAPDAQPGARPGVHPGAHARVRDDSEPMVSCARCGTYVPVSEAVRTGGRDYCCPAHAQQAGS